jgi:chromosome segregation ATPase
VTARIRKAEDAIQKAEEHGAEIVRTIEELGERIDLTPNNKSEQRALLKELRATKKDLGAQKREAKASMADIRRDAREQASAAAPAVSSTWSRKMAAAERRAIRDAKDRALQPHEDEVSALERQIAAVERRIAWVQRFGDEEPDES